MSHRKKKDERKRMFDTRRNSLGNAVSCFSPLRLSCLITSASMCGNWYLNVSERNKGANEARRGEDNENNDTNTTHRRERTKQKVETNPVANVMLFKTTVPPPLSPQMHYNQQYTSPPYDRVYMRGLKKHITRNTI